MVRDFNDHLIIETPEQVPLEFPLAGIGSRFLALALDTVIQLGAIVLITLAAVRLFMAPSMAASRRDVWIAAVLALAYFLVIFVYFAFFETVWCGQTPGKRYLRLRVIKDSGRPILVYDAVARNLLRIIDSIPGFYAVGVVCALLNPQSRRLGDYVAGTVVVCERQSEWKKGISFPEGGFSQPVLRPELNLCRLPLEEFKLIEAFLVRRGQLPANVRHEMAKKIAARIAVRLRLPSDSSIPAEPLLEQVATQYRDHAKQFEDSG